MHTDDERVEKGLLWVFLHRLSHTLGTQELFKSLDVLMGQRGSEEASSMDGPEGSRCLQDICIYNRRCSLIVLG